jgi:glycerol kinase
MSKRKKVALVVSLAATSVYVHVVTSKGDLIYTAQERFSLNESSPGWVEYDPLGIVYTVRSAINTALTSLKLTSDSVKALSVTGEPFAYLAWDKRTGLALSPALSVTCSRLKSSYRKFGMSTLNQHIRDTTGAALSDTSPFLALDVVTSMVDHHSKHVVYGGVESWVMSHLTGFKSCVVDTSFAQATQCFDPNSGKWDSMILGHLDIPPSSLPKVVTDNEGIGETKGFVPLLDGTPVVGFRHKVVASMGGLSALQFGDGYLELSERLGRFFVSVGEESFPNATPDSVLMFQNGTRRNVLEKQLVFPKLPDYVGELSQVLGNISDFLPGHSELMMIPYSTRDGVKSLVKGLSDNTTREDWGKALVDSISFSVKQFMESWESELGFRARRLFITGNLAQYDVLVQTLSNVLQVQLIQGYPFFDEAYGFESAFAQYLGTPKTKKKQAYFKTTVPNVDPISNFATYNQWSQLALTV